MGILEGFWGVREGGVAIYEGPGFPVSKHGVPQSRDFFPDYHSPRNFYKLIPLPICFCNFFCKFYGNSLRPPIFSVTLMRSSGSRVDWKIFFVIFTKLIPRNNCFCIAKILVLINCH